MGFFFSPARLVLFDDLLITGFAACGAVVEAILTEADMRLSQAMRTVALAVALVFRPVALHAVAGGFAVGHSMSLARAEYGGKFRW